MRADEIRDAGSLAGTAAGDVADLARDVHRAVAARLFALAGAPATPIRIAHDGIAALAHGATKLGVRWGPPGVALLAGALVDPTAASVHDAPRGRFVLGAISGFFGDRMGEQQAAIAPQMRVRSGRGVLRGVPANVACDAADDPTTTGRLVVFVHGLCETDLCWSYAAEQRWGDRAATYGSKLRDDDGWTPLYLNFNTGLHVSANGRELADLLERTVAAWPVPVTDVAIVGHSLGGLVARSAAHQADELGHAWRHRLRHVGGRGVPHLGAPLERATNWGTHRLARHPETRPFATWLNRRSVGIKDLRYGATVAADWQDHDPDELLQDRCTAAALLPDVTYSTVSATLSSGTEGVFATDLLVQHASAHGIGATRSIPFEPEHRHHIGGGKHHFDLLADPTVYAALRGWLAEPAGATG